MTTSDAVRTIEQAGFTVAVGNVVIMKAGACFIVKPSELETVAETLKRGQPLLEMLAHGETKDTDGEGPS